MRFLYLVKDGDNKSTAFRKPEEVTLFDRQKATETGYKWLTEEEAIEVKLMIPNSSGHWGIITNERTWQVPVKVEDSAIWCYWLLKWYAIHAYHMANKKPSKMVMQQVATTHNIEFKWTGPKTQKGLIVCCHCERIKNGISVSEKPWKLDIEGDTAISTCPACY